jgi:cytochrome c-type biogenesis protein CcmH
MWVRGMWVPHPSPQERVGQNNLGSMMKRFLTRRPLQLLVLALAIPFLAGASNDEARFNDIGHKMMCSCGCSQILLECNHVGCTQSDKMRNQLAAAVQRGDNDDLILSTFVGTYGPAILAAPIRGGFDRVAWIMPFLVFVLATGVAVWIIRIWKSRPSVVAAASAPAVTPELDRFRDQARKETEL